VKRVRLLVAALVVLFAAQQGAAVLVDAGRVEFVMLTMEYSARDMALAGASVALPSGLSGFHANPAALGYVDKVQAVVGYRSVMDDVWGGIVAMGMPLGKTGFWSLNVINLSEGTVPEVDRQNDLPVATGETWRSDAFCGSLSWSRVLWRTLSLGASLKGAYRYTGSEAEAYSTDAIALDAGLQYRALMSRFVAGLAVRNLGALRSTYTEGSERYALPASVEVGLSYAPRYTPALRMVADLEKTKGAYADVKLGLEIAALKDILFLRGGWSFSEQDISAAIDVMAGEDQSDYEKSSWNSLCLGLGVNTKIGVLDVGLDAAVQIQTIRHASVGISALVGF
jgi:hypothetical protein